MNSILDSGKQSVGMGDATPWVRKRLAGGGKWGWKLIAMNGPISLHCLGDARRTVN